MLVYALLPISIIAFGWLVYFRTPRVMPPSREEETQKASCEIVKGVISHNTSPIVLEDFENLDNMLRQMNLEFRTELKGYVFNEET